MSSIKKKVHATVTASMFIATIAIIYFAVRVLISLLGGV